MLGASNDKGGEKDDEWIITTFTYNINGQKPTRDAINRWLLEEEDLHYSDVVSIALQEISHAEIFSAVSRCESWTDSLNEWLCARDFVLITREHLASNLLLVYCAPHLLKNIARLDSKWTRTTFAGHKGTVSCRILFKDGLSLVFLASHFVHGEENLQLRVEQFNSSLHCTFNDMDLPSSMKLYRDVAVRNVTFWMGDFNFRIEGYKNSSNSLIALLNKEAPPNKSRNSLITSLIENYDQLTKCRCSGKVFKGFQEPLITFLPTYRILVDNGEYDSLRMPSWCDRVLYKTSANLTDRLQTVRYVSCRQITASDHFPVSATFRLHDRRKRTSHHDANANSSSPSGRLSSSPRWACVFTHIPMWASSIPFVCRFRIDSLFWRTAGAYRDWLGVYVANVGAVAKPIYWVYALTCYSDDTVVGNSPRPGVTLPRTEGTDPPTSYRQLDNKSTSSLTESECSLLLSNDSRSALRMVAEFPALLPGRYRVGYFSIKQNCLYGLSKVFHVTEAK